MNAFETLRQIAADPHETGLTARQIIERRLGRKIGPLATMPPHLRTALKLLALERVKWRISTIITPTGAHTCPALNRKKGGAA